MKSKQKRRKENKTMNTIYKNISMKVNMRSFCTHALYERDCEFCSMRLWLSFYRAGQREFNRN